MSFQKISICIPCYRSAKTLPGVVSDIEKVFASGETRYQIILVNDGSPDNTYEVIRELNRTRKNIIGVDLSRNYGQASAKLAGLSYADGDALIFMDDDGQHPASGIPKLLAKLDEGYDVVYAEFKNKKHSAFKRLTSNLFNRLAEAMGNKPKGMKKSSFVAWSRVVMDAVRTYHSPFVSVGAFLMSVTTKFAGVEIEHQERAEGKSGYTLKRLMRLAMNTFFSFSFAPLRLASYLGLLFTGVGFIGILVLLIKKIAGSEIRNGNADTLLVVLFIGGIILIVLGIMGEYLGRIYSTVSGKPQYFVRDVTGKDEEAP